ncbi:hypothetical protein [Kitasatospora sp. NPDC088783]|uniref:hypothetical protein n=1 Tax=Kitasatospora sp. NPDC088783 TaxID=3364077 RepID=UPI0038293FBD
MGPNAPGAAAAGPLAPALELLGAGGVLSVVRAAVELYGSYGDPHARLSATRVDQLCTVAELFADYDGPLEGPLRLVGEVGVLGALRSAVALYDTLHDPDEALNPEQVECVAVLSRLFAAQDGGACSPARAGDGPWPARG